MTTQDPRAKPSNGHSSQGAFAAHYTQSRFPPSNEDELPDIINDDPSSSDELSVTCIYRLRLVAFNQLIDTAYNPPSASTPEQMINTLDSQKPATAKYHATNSTNKDSSLDTHQRTISPLRGPLDNMRVLAKEALFSLLPNVGYNDFVDEGVHPQLLRELFEELGVDNLPLPPQGPPETHVQSPKIDKSQGSGGSVPSADGSLISKPTKVLVASKSHDPANTPSNTSVVPEAAELQSTTSSTQARFSPSSSVPVKSTHLVAPQNSVPMSRKDLIAQRLAAKTGRTLPSQSPETPGNSAITRIRASSTDVNSPAGNSRSVQAPLVPNPVLDTRPRNLAVSSNVQVGDHTEIPLSKHSVGPNNSSPSTAAEKSVIVPTDANVRMKSKAQTELVRKKMEALKKEALARQQATKIQDQPVSRVDATAASAPDTPLAPLKESIRSSDPAEMPRPEAVPPLHVSSKHSFASQIPGLFLAASDSPQSHADEFLEQLDISSVPVDSHDAFQDASTLANRQDIASQQQPNISSFHTSTRPLSSHFEHVASPKIAQLAETLPIIDPSTGGSRSVSKRPVALDSFDDSDGQRKRPFGRKESNDHVEIVLSEEGEDYDEEEEEEDEEEGEIGMDLDEISEGGDGSGGDANVDTSPASTRSNDEVTKTPISTHPLPAKPTIATMTSSVQTPSDNTKEDLFRTKNMEIEAMRRRIAEMEARAKAKRAVSSRAQSPKSSAPSTPMAPQTAAPATPFQENSQGRELSRDSLTPLPLVNDASRAEALRSRLLRRRQIEEGLPSIDAEVVKARSLLAEKQSRLAEMQLEARRREAEMQEEADRIAASIQHNLNNKKVLVDELEQMGVDVDSLPLDEMPIEELEARRDRLLEEHEKEDQSAMSDAESYSNEAHQRDLSVVRDKSEAPAQSLGDQLEDKATEVGASEIIESGAVSSDRSSSSLEDEASLQLRQGMAIEAQDSPMGGAPLQEIFTQEQIEYGPDGDDASVSMSDDESEDYEPMDPVQEEEESDAYEPPDTSLNQTEILQQSQPNVNPVGAELASEEEDNAMEIDEEPYEPQDVPHSLDDDDEFYEPPQPEHIASLVETGLRSSITPPTTPNDNVGIADLQADRQVHENEEVQMQRKPQVLGSNESRPEPSATVRTIYGRDH